MLLTVHQARQQNGRPTLLCCLARQFRCVPSCVRLCLPHGTFIHVV